MINMRKKSTSEIGDNKSNRQNVYQRGSNQTTDNSPHYVFLYSDDDDDCDEETIILQSRNKIIKNNPRKIEVINVTLKNDDTLQSLALKYCCTISELKRINNIHRDNEIYARRTIKVPVQPYSFLTETNSTNLLDLNNDNTSTELLNNNLSNDQKIMNIKNNQTILFTKTNDDINNVILNSICEPLSSTLLQNDDVDIDNVDNENEQLLLTNENNNNNNDTSDLLLSCSGADWGLSWRQLIGVSLLLSFAGPVIYILYIAENSQRHIKT